ncbi:MAG: c-type cytochrome biogenesis protein CcmI, partial [Methyloligellaceae bacterium]
MVLWIIFAALTAAVLTAVLWPVMRARSQDAARAAYDSAIYRDQLQEIETDLERGLIGEGEAEAAKTEISRRLLSAADAGGNDGAARASRSPIFALVSVLVCVPLLGLALYLTYGSPALPDQPLAARLKDAPATQKIAALVARVEERLRQHPEDGAGWDVIAPVYLKHRRYQDAAEAYERVIRLLGESTPRLAGYGEALVLQNNGIVPEAARRAFEKVLASDKSLLKPRFWLAMAKEQDGKLAEAATAWREMLTYGSKGAPWRKVVEQRLQVVESKLGTGGAAKPDAVAKAEEKPERGPTAEDVKAARQMTPEQRMAMITQMVEGLALRLKEDGNDLK